MTLISNGLLGDQGLFGARLLKKLEEVRSREPGAIAALSIKH